MMSFQDKVKDLLRVHPEAIDIRVAGNCDVCHGKDSLLFFALPEYPAEETVIRDDVYVKGGLYCTRCGFGNPGGIPADVYHDATVAIPELFLEEE